jgi:hypothetical protein
MDFVAEITSAKADPQRLEELYRGAEREHQTELFRTSMAACFEQSPGNLLYAAWYYRLTPGGYPVPAERDAGANWKLAIPLGLAAGLLLWLLSSPGSDFPTGTPLLLALWAPLEACFVLAYLLGSTRRPLRVYLPVLLGLVGLTAVAFACIWYPRHSQYELLMLIHLPLVAWSAIGLCLAGWRSGHSNRFAFLAKSLEVFCAGAIFGGALGLFGLITNGLFQALGIDLAMQLPEPVLRLLIAGSFGAIPVLAVASVYDPRLEPLQQRVESGLGRLIPTVMRLLLPLSLVVGAAYLVAIPFNFMGPFNSRDLLIVYNAMLFAVLSLLVGATPVHEEDLPAHLGKWLRAGILALAAMAVVVSVYALSATVYRTLQGALTPNRLTVIGWNCINIAILVVMLYRMVRRGAQTWSEAVHSAIGQGAMAYIFWTAALVLGLPILFG